MLREADDAARRKALTAAIAAHAAARDADGGFPAEAFAELDACGWLGQPPLGSGQMPALLRLLAAVGRGDLNAGRIFEGHVNALTLIRSHGDATQRDAYERLAGRGAAFGVWNTDAPGEPLSLGADGRLTGKKNFASGVDGLSHAIVTVTDDEGRRRMIVVPVAGALVDRTWWRPVGMRASGSHVIDLTGVAVPDAWMLGAPDAYIAQPWFSAGAIRFLAVQAGGMHAVLDVARAHLNRTGRAGDPHQAQRLARMGVAVQGAYGWLDHAAAAWSEAERSPEAGDRLMAAANGARGAVEAAALVVLEEAERAIGAAGMIAPHPFERLMRDLRTYLRQPNPDGAATAFGAAVASGAWEPDFTCPAERT